jgi:hypothetical protein
MQSHTATWQGLLLCHTGHICCLGSQQIAGKCCFAHCHLADSHTADCRLAVWCVCCVCCAERVQDGVFGAMMNVALENDGPVTFILDSGHQGSGHH